MLSDACDLLYHATRDVTCECIPGHFYARTSNGPLMASRLVQVPTTTTRRPQPSRHSHTGICLRHACTGNSSPMSRLFDLHEIWTNGSCSLNFSNRGAISESVDGRRSLSSLIANLEFSLPLIYQPTMQVGFLLWRIHHCCTSFLRTAELGTRRMRRVLALNCRCNTALKVHAVEDSMQPGPQIC